MYVHMYGNYIFSIYNVYIDSFVYYIHVDDGYIVFGREHVCKGYDVFYMVVEG